MKATNFKSRMVARGFDRVERRGGFTLIEALMLVVMAGILVALILPAIQKAHFHSGASCINNLKQVTLAWIMYTEDNHHNLAPNPPNSRPGGWVNGVMSWSGDNKQNTNTDLIAQGLLARYVGNYKLFHCPADTSAAQGQGLRVRSYSMNGYIGNANATDATHVSQMADFWNPTKAVVFLEEHPDSINDGHFILNGTNRWTDLPASAHSNKGAGFSFADGHSEIHGWVDDSTLKPIAKISRDGLPLMPASGQSKDIVWLFSRMTNPPAFADSSDPGIH